MRPWNRDGDTAEIPITPPPTSATIPPTITPNQAPYPTQAPWPAPTTPSTQPSTEPRTVRRPSPHTRRRSRTVATGFAILALVLYLAGRWGHPLGINLVESHFAWQLPALGCVALLTPALIRMRTPAAWALPLTLAAGAAAGTWITWQGTRAPTPTHCGVISNVLNSCTITAWPWWLTLIHTVILTYQCLTLAWNVWEDSITPIEVDLTHTR